MTLRGLVSALLLGLLLPQTVKSDKNCAQPNARVNIATVELKDRLVQSEVIISSDKYATTTITRAAGTLTKTRTEPKTVTEFFLDAGCVVSSGSAIYTLSASATVTQDGAVSVSFWVSSLCLEFFAQFSVGFG